MMMMTTATVATAVIPPIKGVDVELEDDEPWILVADVCITIRIILF